MHIPMMYRTNARKFVTGEEFLYLGKKYPLIVSTDVKQALLFDKDKKAFLLNSFNQKNAETFFINWYKRQALALFSKRVASYALQAKVEYQSISLSNADSKWGSCNFVGAYCNTPLLMFNWRLIMAPMPAIDSVIFHELAHIMEKNHTKKFWRRVTMWFPDYVNQKAWLDTHGHTLRIS